MLCWPNCIKYIYPEIDLKLIIAYCNPELNGTTIYDMQTALCLLEKGNKLYINATQEMLEKDLSTNRKIIILSRNHYRVLKRKEWENLILYDPTLKKEVLEKKEYFFKKWYNEGNKVKNMYISLI